MEQLYYILDTSTNTPVIENITYDQAMEWLEQNGIASIHILTSY
jgi:hypothetical protein